MEYLDALPHPTAAQQALADLLTLLIEEFEECHYALRAGGPIDRLKELMAANGLKQKDLLEAMTRAGTAPFDRT